MNLQENIHRIKQVMKLMEQEQEILKIPSIELFGDWNTLQKFLERRGNPPYTIGGDVDLYGSDVIDLGNLTSVGGYLDLFATPIKSLGNLSSVGNFLDLDGTLIESLGNLTSIGGNLNLTRTPIKSLGNLQSVGGNLILNGTPIAKKYTLGQIRKMINVKGAIYS